VWCTWLFALQGGIASAGLVGAFVPDLGLVVLLAICARLDRDRARRAAIVIAAVRIAFTADPPLAVVAGYVGVAWVLLALRGVVEVERLAPRALFGGLGALVLGAFWSLAHARELALRGIAVPPPERLGAAALATALVAAAAVPWVARLPGLSPLTRPRARRIVGRRG